MKNQFTLYLHMQRRGAAAVFSKRKLRQIVFDTTVQRVPLMLIMSRHNVNCSETNMQYEASLFQKKNRYASGPL